MDFLEELFENLFERKKIKGWNSGGHHGGSNHHGRKNYLDDRYQVRCPGCGVQNDPANDFCAACGARLVLNQSSPQFVNCGHCGSQNNQDKAFCEACGAPLSKVAPRACPLCISFPPPDARFCPKCGRAV